MNKRNTTKATSTKTTSAKGGKATKAAPTPETVTHTHDQQIGAVAPPAKKAAKKPAAPKPAPAPKAVVAPVVPAPVAAPTVPAGLVGLGLGPVAGMDTAALRAMYEQGARDFRTARTAGDRAADARAWRAMAQAAIAMVGGVVAAPVAAPTVQLAKGGKAAPAKKAAKAG